MNYQNNVSCLRWEDGLRNDKYSIYKGWFQKLPLWTSDDGQEGQTVKPTILKNVNEFFSSNQ